ncbi:MAG TPA: DUF302 domain-containing protein [Gemmatimonadales bacterium]
MSDTLSFDVDMAGAYDHAIDRVTTALQAEGFGILTRIDVDKTLKEKIGVDFRPYAILGACNPPLAHKALQHDARVGLMLPCNVTVEAREGGGATVRIGNPTTLMQASGLTGDTLGEVAAEARIRLERVADALRGSPS